jgi:hypothetical protein
MPIAQVFDPYTGAANGGGVPSGGGGSSAWVEVTDLTDPSFTASDPNALLSGYSYNASTKVHSFSLVTVNPANADYAVSSGSNFTGPRWYKPLVDANGTPVLASDRFVMLTRFTALGVGASRQWCAYVGAAQTPASTTLTVLSAMGNWAGGTGVGTPNAGAHAVNIAGTGSLASGTTIYGANQYSGVPGKLKVGSNVSIQSTTAGAIAQRVDGAAWSIADGTQLSLWLACSTLGTVITTAGTLDCTISYAIVRM